MPDLKDAESLHQYNSDSVKAAALEERENVETKHVVLRKAEKNLRGSQV